MAIDWEAYSDVPLQQPPTGEDRASEDQLGRARFRSELDNPETRRRLIAYTEAEVGGQGDDARQAFIETTFNRSVARNQTIPQTLSGSYFPNITHSRANRQVSDLEHASYKNIIDDVLNGSNITNFATGNASGRVGFAGGPQTAKFGGERFGIEGPDRDWWNRREDIIPAAARPTQGELDPITAYLQGTPPKAPTPTAAAPVTPEAPTPTPQPTAQARDPVTEYLEGKPQEGAVKPELTAQETPPPTAQTPQHWAVTRGFVTTMAKQNPEGLADFLEGQSYGAPEAAAGPMRSAADKVREFSKGITPEGFEPQIKSMYDISGVGDALTWAGEQLGQGVASSMPSVVLGGLGMLAGGATPIPGGAVVGGLTGAASASYVQNYGEVYRALRDNGVEPAEANRYANIATPAIAGLDIASLGNMGRLLGVAGARKEIVGGLARRIATAAAEGFGGEFTTEAAQEFLKDATVTAATGKPLFTQEAMKGWLEAGVAGGIPGGAMGGAAGVRRTTPTGPVPSLDESLNQLTTTPEGDPIPQPVVQGAPKIESSDLPSDAVHFATTTDEGLEIRALIKDQQPIWYSRLYEAAKAKLPESAPATQMLATLKNQPGVKEAEMADTGLDAYLRSQPGKVSKTNVLEFLEQNGIEVGEAFTTRGEETPTAFDSSLAPGPVQSYTELRLTVPVRQGEEVRSPHWDEPNVVAHVQATTRIDKAGNPVLHIEGIQSDWHQLGRKIGYLTEGEVATIRGMVARQDQIRERIGNNNAMAERLVSQPVVDEERLSQIYRDNRDLREEFINISSDIRNIRLSKDDLLHEKLRPPPAPFKSNWVDLAIKRMVRWAADNGYSKISWASPELAIAWNTGAHGQMQRIRPEIQSGLREFYGKIIPSRMKKIIAEYGGVLGRSDIDTSSPEYRMEVHYNPNAVRGPYEVWMPESQRPMARFATRENAEAWVRFKQEEQRDVQASIGPITSVYHVTIPDSAKTAIQNGMAMYKRVEKGGPDVALSVSGGVRDQPGGAAFLAAANKMKDVFMEFAKKFGFDTKVTMHIIDRPIQIGRNVYDAYGLAVRNLETGTYDVYVRSDMHQANIAAFYSTMMHEFGHVVFWEKFAALDDNTKLQIREAYDKWRRETQAAGTRGALYTSKIPPAFAKMLFSREQINLKDSLTLLDANMQNYHFGDQLGFEEWMADQVSKWATATAQPMSIVEKAFAGIGKALRLFLEWASRSFGVEVRPELLIQNWLNSYIDTAAPMTPAEYTALDFRTQKENQFYVADNVDMPPRQAETTGVRDALDQLYPSGPPKAVKEAAAHADRINWFYKFFAGLLDLAAANPRFAPLLRYVEKASAMHRDESRIQDSGVRIAKDWRKLGRAKGSQGDALFHFLDEITNMTYLTPDEQNRGVQRNPTPQEAADIAKRVGLNNEGAAMAARIKAWFDTFLDLVASNDLAEANKITDLTARIKRIDEINGQIKALRSKPYFPFMRFGRHYVTVRDKAGTVIYFDTFERKGLKSAQSRQQDKVAELSAIHGKDAVESGMLPEESEPLIGMPKPLLDAIRNKLNLTPAQLDALEQLQFQLSPALSFKHHSQHKNYVPGYSDDFMRAFSRYAFHGARHFVRTKYVGDMTQDIKDARKVGGNKAHRIADYMADHLDKTLLNAKGDYGIFKGAIFLWTFGYFPAGATQNMSQTPMVTWPYLASKFGDVQASKAVVKAMGQLTNLYRRRKFYEGQKDWVMRAISYGIKTGRISETQAPELAGLSQGGTLLWGNGGTPVQRSANWILEKGAVFFELAEQWNRRIAFRAALELASNNPDAKIVQEALTRYPDEFRVLTQVEGFTPSQARAIITANHAVEQTQFVYARYARPRFMRGRLAGSLFVFKRYIQGLLFLGFNNPSFALRYVMIAMLMGGMGGVPFYEDLKGLVEGILRYFGQNANAERLIRQWVADYFGDSPPVPADVILHGMARRGFGVPALLDHLGSYATGRPGRGLLSTMPGQNIAFPQLDRSKAITSGPIFPIEFKALLDPTADTNKTIAEQSQKAAGAIFSVGFNMYKFLMDNHLSISDPKRWERALPRELAAISKTWRTYTEGRDRYGPKASGSTVINYDVRDTEQLMEVIALGLGYNNLRSTSKWDKVMDEREYDQYWQHQRNAIYEQYYEALKTGQEEEIAAARKALQKFNMDVAGTPARAYAISSEKLLQSMKARERARLGRESGIPVQKQNIPIAREIERLHPEAGNVIDVRRVR